jgi:organic radical activating enzyme
MPIIEVGRPLPQHPDGMNLVYKISEIFYSIQGEGLLQGLPMIFIRLSGCNLRCSFCDTKYAFKKRRTTDAAEILAEIRQYPCKRVCITGGEPFLQNLSPLVNVLKEKNYFVCAETNGTLWQKLPIDWLTVSPKTGGRKFHARGYDKRFLNAASEFKYVITGRRSFSFIDKKIKASVILQPVDNDIKTAGAIAEFLKENPGKNRYLRMQMHKTAGLK